MIRRFIRLNTFKTTFQNDVKEKEELIMLEKIHSVSIHSEFDDALCLMDENDRQICSVKMSMDELIKIMKSPIEIEI